MYIVAIAWLYVALMMALTEPSITGGVLTLLFYGILPCALFLWLFGTPQRKRNRLGQVSQQDLGQPDRADAHQDQ